MNLKFGVFISNQLPVYTCLFKNTYLFYYIHHHLKGEMGNMLCNYKYITNKMRGLTMSRKNMLLTLIEYKGSRPLN